MSLQFHKLNEQATIVPNEDILADVTADLIVRAFTQILAKKDTVTFIPSSGRTPLKTYKRLAGRYKTAIDWSRVTLIQMDEYLTDELDEALYFHSFIQQHLITPLGIKRYLSLRPKTGKGIVNVQDYARQLSKLGPIDFALHGIGRNGHIGFNEPNSSPQSETRIVKLSDATCQDNFSNIAKKDRPQYGITLGLKDLMAVRHTLLIATGLPKAMAVRNLLNHHCVSETPACALWNNSDFGVIVDMQAASLVI